LYSPIKHINPASPLTACNRCSHYARNLPSCACTTGYSEPVIGGSVCTAPIPLTCSKFVRIESASLNGAEYDRGAYLRMYMNDVSLGTFGRGFNFKVLD